MKNIIVTLLLLVGWTAHAGSIGDAGSGRPISTQRSVKQQTIAQMDIKASKAEAVDARQVGSVKKKSLRTSSAVRQSSQELRNTLMRYPQKKGTTRNFVTKLRAQGMSTSDISQVLLLTLRDATTQLYHDKKSWLGRLKQHQKVAASLANYIADLSVAAAQLNEGALLASQMMAIRQAADDDKAMQDSMHDLLIATAHSAPRPDHGEGPTGGGTLTVEGQAAEAALQGFLTARRKLSAQAHGSLSAYKKQAEAAREDAQIKLTIAVARTASSVALARNLNLKATLEGNPLGRTAETSALQHSLMRDRQILAQFQSLNYYLMKSGSPPAFLADLIPVNKNRATQLCDVTPDRARLRIHIRNQGSGNAAISRTKVYFSTLSGSAIGQHILHTPIIEAGKTKTLSITLPRACYSSGCSFAITADATTNVRESNEKNNTARGSCSKTPQPRISPRVTQPKRR